MSISNLEQITFGTYKSYDHFGLILSKKEIEFPQPKLDKLSVPYMDGEYDFSEASGELYYDRRKLSFEFIYPNAYPMEFELKMNAIANLIHGKVMDVKIGSESAYNGRVTINGIASDRLKGVIKVEVDAKPFRGSGAIATRVLNVQDTAYNATLTSGGLVGTDVTVTPKKDTTIVYTDVLGNIATVEAEANVKTELPRINTSVSFKYVHTNPEGEISTMSCTYKNRGV